MGEESYDFSHATKHGGLEKHGGQNSGKAQGLGLGERVKAEPHRLLAARKRRTVRPGCP